jgi:endonuclease-8
VPEGDTLRRLADRIDAAFAGQRVERSELRDPRLAGRDLTGRVLVGADAYGKHLFVRFDDGRSLHAHLMMDGSFAVGRPSREPEWKRRVEFWFPDGRLTGESVPILELLATADEHTVTDRLGPDLCRPESRPDPGAIADRMRASPEDPLTGSLLDQRNAAGFGNVYVHEVPFVTGVNPFQPVGSIDRLDELVAVGVALIRTNARLGPQNTTGRRLQTDARYVHGVGRRPCPVCGERLSYRKPSSTPWGRSITWCERCQLRQEHVSADINRAQRLLALHPARRELPR